jgi:hypothetical protein
MKTNKRTMLTLTLVLLVGLPVVVEVLRVIFDSNDADADAGDDCDGWCDAAVVEMLASSLWL